MMKRQLPACIALALTAVLTFGAVYPVHHFSQWADAPSYTYQAVIVRMLSMGFEWQGELFANFYAWFTFLVFPFVGLGAFLIGSRRNIGSRAWKPLLVAIVLTVPLRELIGAGFMFFGLDATAAQAVRAMVVLSLMIWSIDFHVSGGLEKTSEVPT